MVGNAEVRLTRVLDRRPHTLVLGAGVKTREISSGIPA